MVVKDLLPEVYLNIQLHCNDDLLDLLTFLREDAKWNLVKFTELQCDQTTLIYT